MIGQRVNAIREKIKDMRIAKKIMILLLMVSLISLSVMMIVYYQLTGKAMRAQANELIWANLEQSASNVQNFWETYEGIIQSIYIDDFYGEQMEPINLWDNNKYQYARAEIIERLENIVYTNDDILGILIVGEYQDTCFYDSVTSSSQVSYCFDLDSNALKNNVYLQNALEENTIVYSSLEHISSAEFGNRDVLYIACHLKDLRSFEESPMACVMLCVDEQALQEVYKKSNTSANITLVTNQYGDILSFPMDSLAGVNIIEETGESAEGADKGERVAVDQTAVEQAAIDFIQKNDYLQGSKLEAVSKSVRNGSCYVINVQDSGYAMRKFVSVVGVMLMLTVLVGAVCVIIAIRFSGNLDSSIKPILHAMEAADQGDLQVRISPRGNDEFAWIARQFNKMIEQIRISNEQEKETLLRIKNEEIKSLEAQINPHFLYNTLDAINWVAIDQGEYTISRMLTTLAEILRYSVHKSNEVVTIRDELEYLRKYVYLQQQRFEYSFVCTIDADETVLSYQIHKLLIQPLLENALVHAFPGNTGMDEVGIQISKIEQGTAIQIVVADNGIGMEPDKVEFFNHFDYQKERIESSIGLRNVITRLKLYYGEKGSFYLESDKNGTKITMRIPYGV